MNGPSTTFLRYLFFINVQFDQCRTDKIPNTEEETNEGSNLLEKTAAELPLSQNHLFFQNGNSPSPANVVNTVKFCPQMTSNFAKHLQNEYGWIMRRTQFVFQAALVK